MTDTSLSSVALWVAGIGLFQFAVGRVKGPSGNSHQPPRKQDAAVVASSLFPPRDALHLQRKVQHALTGLLFYAASLVLPVTVATALLYALSVLFLVLHELRKRYPQVDDLYVASFRGILRQDEAAGRVLPGAFYFLLGTALIVTIYPLSVARLALLHVSGDSIYTTKGSLADC